MLLLQVDFVGLTRGYTMAYLPSNKITERNLHYPDVRANESNKDEGFDRPHEQLSSKVNVLIPMVLPTPDAPSGRE